MRHIHPLAYVEEGAQLGEEVTIEPFAVVKKGVILRDKVTVKSHAYLDGNTEIGEGTTIWPSASIGTKTQDLKFRGETTYVKIGKNCDIREFVTINSSCQEGNVVSIGDGCLIMAYCHVAHNCTVGNRVIMANSAMLAGHVTVADDAIIGGMTPIHQFSRIGKFAMVGGFSRVAQDIPPFTIGGGYPYRFGGINLVGLKRNRFPLEIRSALSHAFRLTYRSGLRLDEALRAIEEQVVLCPEVRHWIEFCRTSKRGLTGLEGITQDPSPSEEGEESLVEK